MRFREIPSGSGMFYDLPCVSIAFHWVLLTFHWVLPLSYLISSYLLILSYLFLVFCFPARFWCRDICDGFKYPRGYPHVRHWVQWIDPINSPWPISDNALLHLCLFCNIQSSSQLLSESRSLNHQSRWPWVGSLGTSSVLTRGFIPCCQVLGVTQQLTR